MENNVQHTVKNKLPYYCKIYKIYIINVIIILKSNFIEIHKNKLSANYIYTTDTGDDNMFGHLGHIVGESRVTLEADSITPGTIYIDMDKRTRKGIYKAYKNGASLIITDKNVSDPRIPTIRVKDTEETYFSLLNLLYGKPIDKISLIGVYGGNKADVVVKLLDGVFAKYFAKSVENREFTDFAYTIISNKLKYAAERLFYYIALCVSRNIKIIPINSCRGLKRFEEILKNRYDCNILIDENTIEKCEMYSIGKGKVLIINIDNPYILKAIDGQKENIAITFGLNKKAAVTATSIEYGEITKFNYCLQRTICSKSGRTIEPFEVPMAIKGLGINKIYSALAAISCALYYDVDMECIKEALCQYDDSGRDFSIVNYDDFTFINSYCMTENDYKETFEKIQMLDYKDLHIIISGSQLHHRCFSNYFLNLVNEWSSSLDIKELIILSNQNQDTITDNNKFPANIHIKYFDQLAKALMSSIRYLSGKDILLVIGGDEMSSAQYIIELLLQSKL